MPFISVIVPNYNHERFLVQRLTTIFNQTYQDFEVILLDDCSTDKSREILDKHKTHEKVTHAFYNPENSGSPFAQWQVGIQLAKGEYIWIAESDDFAEPDFLEKMVKIVESNKNVGIAFSNSNWVDERGCLRENLSLYEMPFCRLGTDEILTMLKYNTVQNASAVLIKSTLAKANVGNIIGFKSCGDWIMYIKVLTTSNICYTNLKLNNFRWYHGNVSHRSKERGLWLIEGIKILGQLKPSEISITRDYLYELMKYWSLKIYHSRSLAIRHKILLLLKLGFFGIRFWN